jgi:hypothetical protein
MYQGGSMHSIKNINNLFGMRLITFFFILTSMVHSLPVVVSGGPENDYEGWIARLNDGRLMVIFTRNPDWISGDLYVTFSPDNGMTWDSVIPIIEENGDQATLSFVQLPDDTLCLWYASNEDGQYGIYEARSYDGLLWSRRGRMNLGWSPSDMYYDPTVILEPDSSLTMSYRGPGGAYIAHRPYGQDWDTLKTLVNTGGYRPRIMKYYDGTYLYVYHRNTGGAYEVFSRTSIDRITWTNEVQLTHQGNSHDPFANDAPDPKYLVYYATYNPPAYNLYRRASWNGIAWETEYPITADITNNTQPHYFIESNEVYLLWAHAVNYPDDHDVYFERSTYFGIEDMTTSVIPDIIKCSVSPNPCKDRIQLKMSAIKSQYTEISLYNIMGKRTGDPITCRINQGFTYSFNTTGLPAGIYFIKILYGDKNEIIKAVVIK